MTIHKAGIIPIITLTFASLAILAMMNYLVPEQTNFHFFMYAVAVLFVFFVVRFFRFPRRSSVVDDSLVYSAADGRVVAIEKVTVDEYFADERIQVSVFMSPLNVHVNWSPISGKVAYRKYHPGKHIIAFKPKSSMVNEHTSVVFRHGSGREVMIRQIAGALARRIIFSHEEGQTVGQGEPVGIIKFGSRVDHLLPADAEVLVKIGDVARATDTVLARFPASH